MSKRGKGRKGGIALTTKVINLDRLLSNMIHHPRIDGVPLYTRVDGEVDIGASNKGDRWERASKRSYGSPGNIRRLFITYRAVYVHLYQPVVGVKNRSNIREIVFPTDFVSINNSINKATMNGERPPYRVSKLGLRALVRPWVCSNIEEIYFDDTLFMSEDSQNLGLGHLGDYYGQKVVGLSTPEPIKLLFETSVSIDNVEIAYRFPRLRCVGYMEALEKIYKNTPNKRGVESIEDMLKPWYSNVLVGEAIRSPNTNVAIYRLQNVGRLNSKFSLKDGVYLYDKEVLQGYFEGIQLRIKQFVSSHRDKEVDSRKEVLEDKLNRAKSSFEMIMDDVYEKEGRDKAALALRISFAGFSADDKMSVLSGMSEQGRIKYMRLLEIGHGRG